VALIGYLSVTSEVERYRTETDTIVSEAVTEARLAQQEEDTAIFLEEAKKPYVEYVGPSDFGSISFSYPKTWSVYNSQFDKNGYVIVFYPGVIPVVSDTTAMALRISVLNQEYETVIAGYEKMITAGQITASVVNVAQTETFTGYEGIRFDGAINTTFLDGSIIALKLRDKTILIQTDSSDWVTDFEQIVLPTFSYIE
jgi:hypothetical protein